MMLGRRGFLKALGIGATAIAAEELLEPVRKIWVVPSNAPVGSRIERVPEFNFPVEPVQPAVHGNLYDVLDYVEEDIYILKAGVRGVSGLRHTGIKTVPHRYVKGGEAYLFGGSLYVSPTAAQFSAHLKEFGS